MREVVLDEPPGAAAAALAAFSRELAARGWPEPALPEPAAATVAAAADTVLPPTAAALWRWWGASRLVEDLVLGCGTAPAVEVVIGHNWTCVRTATGAGLAQASGGPPGRAKVKRGIDWAGRPLAELARLALAWDPVAAAVGVAALNAHYNHDGLQGPADDGLDADLVVGRFPRLPAELDVVELAPGRDDWPAAALPALAARARQASVTASTLVNHSLPGILEHAWGRVTLVGPGTPLTPRAFSYGVRRLAGFVATDPAGLAQAVAAGAVAAELKPFGRRVMLGA